MTDEAPVTESVETPAPSLEDFRERITKKLEERPAPSEPEKPADEEEPPAAAAPVGEEPKPDESAALKKQKRELAKRERKSLARERELEAKAAQLEARERALEEEIQRDPAAFFAKRGLSMREMLTRQVQQETEDPQAKLAREAKEKAEAVEKQLAEERQSRAQREAIEAQRAIRSDLRSRFEATSAEEYPYLHAFVGADEAAEQALRIVLEEWKTSRRELDPSDVWDTLETALRDEESRRSAAREKLQKATPKGEPPEQVRSARAESPEPRKARATEDLTQRATRVRATSAPPVSKEARSGFDREGVRERLARKYAGSVIP